MRITIREIVKKNPAGDHVLFSCEFGTATGRWGGKEPPQASQVYDVELDVKEVLTWGRTIKPSTDAQPRFSDVGDRVRIQGLLDQQFEGDCASVKVGDSLLMIEAKGHPPPPGSPVVFEIHELWLYDQHL
jgi:hypothetical protein